MEGKLTFKSEEKKQKVGNISIKNLNTCNGSSGVTAATGNSSLIAYFVYSILDTLSLSLNKQTINFFL